jgi:hypothetical protein
MVTAIAPPRWAIAVINSGPFVLPAAAARDVDAVYNSTYELPTRANKRGLDVETDGRCRRAER